MNRRYFTCVSSSFKLDIIRQKIRTADEPKITKAIRKAEKKYMYSQRVHTDHGTVVKFSSIMYALISNASN